ADRKIHGKDGTVRAPPLYVAADADDPFFAGILIMLQILVVLVRVRRRHQHLDVAPDNLVGAVAEQPLAPLVEQLYGAGAIDDDDAVNGSVDHGAKPSVRVGHADRDDE